MTIAPIRPVEPKFILAAALAIPGAGQVFNRQPVRGLTFLFFMMLLGGYTLVTASPEVSLVGKLSGGIFVHAIAVYDAYKSARIRSAVWHYRNSLG